MPSIDEFARGTEHVEDRGHLAARLERGDRLRIKFGVDPTAPDLHLGHTVPMRRLRAWQEMGHTAVIIIGDWTARIGDPSGRNETRPPLTAAQVDENAQTYLAQLQRLLDRERTEVRHQSEWFGPMGLAEVLRLASTRTVQQMLARRDFGERIGGGHAISLHELLYPLLQGYDSVAVDADVEIGGSDQLFNLLAARDVQRAYGRAEPQDVVTLPLLEGLDGVRKMSKSYGNAVGITEAAQQQYGKLMSLPDGLIVRYLTLVTDTQAAEVERIAAELAADRLNPRDAKMLLARTVVAAFHGADAAAAAEGEFGRVHGGQRGLPAGMPEARIAGGNALLEALDLVDRALSGAGIPLSRSQIRRVIDQGGVALTDPDTGFEWRVPAAARAVRVATGSGPGLEVAGQGDAEVATVRSGAVLRTGRRTFVRLQVT